MYDKFYTNGELKIFPTGKKQLKNEALPTIEHQLIPLHQFEDKQHCPEEKHFIEQQHKRVLADEKVLNNFINDTQTVKGSEEQTLIQYLHDTVESHQETEARAPLEDFTDNIRKFPMLPPFWLYIDKPNGFEFVRMDVTTRKILNHLRWNKDTSITVSIYKFPSNFIHCCFLIK